MASDQMTDRESLVLAIAQAALYPSVYMEGCPASYRRTAERIANAVEAHLRLLERRVAARDRRIRRLVLALEDARRQGLVLPGDLEPAVVLSEEA